MPSAAALWLRPTHAAAAPPPPSPVKVNPTSLCTRLCKMPFTPLSTRCLTSPTPTRRLVRPGAGCRRSLSCFPPAHLTFDFSPPRFAAPGVRGLKKALGDLEMSLLHLQQDVEIPHIVLTPHPLVKEVRRASLPPRHPRKPRWFRECK